MKIDAAHLLASWGAFAFLKTTSNVTNSDNLQTVAFVSGIVAVIYTASLIVKTWHEIMMIRKRLDAPDED